MTDYFEVAAQEIRLAREELSHDMQAYELEKERRQRLEIILIKCSSVLDADEMSQLRMECGA